VVGRTRILRRNYRTTRQIVEAAVSLIEGTQAGDEEVLAQEYVHVGPKPVLYFAENASDQIRWIAEQIRHSAQALKLPTSSAAILTPTNWQAEQIATALTEIGMISKHVRGLDLELKTTYIKAMTIHAAKGLEFPIVVIPGFEAGTIPRPLEDERASDREKHFDEQRRITFVAMTRAMRRLFVVCRKGKESPFLEDFDLEQWTIQ
jgi:superfamily I DNA/RNA helicase